MNQAPILIIEWPQYLHSRVRSTRRSRAESGIGLLPCRAGARACLSAIDAGNPSADDGDDLTPNCERRGIQIQRHTVVWRNCPAWLLGAKPDLARAPDRLAAAWIALELTQIAKSTWDCSRRIGRRGVSARQLD